MIYINIHIYVNIHICKQYVWSVNLFWMHKCPFWGCWSHLVTLAKRYFEEGSTFRIVHANQKQKTPLLAIYRHLDSIWTSVPFATLYLFESSYRNKIRNSTQLNLCFPAKYLPCSQYLFSHSGRHLEATRKVFCLSLHIKNKFTDSVLSWDSRHSFVLPNMQKSKCFEFTF